MVICVENHIYFKGFELIKLLHDDSRFHSCKLNINSHFIYILNDISSDDLADWNDPLLCSLCLLVAYQYHPKLYPVSTYYNYNLLVVNWNWVTWWKELSYMMNRIGVLYEQNWSPPPPLSVLMLLIEIWMIRFSFGFYKNINYSLILNRYLNEKLYAHLWLKEQYDVFA